MEIKGQRIPLTSHSGHELYVNSNTPSSYAEVPKIVILKRGRKGLRRRGRTLTLKCCFQKYRSKWSQEYFFKNKILQKSKI